MAKTPESNPQTTPPLLGRGEELLRLSVCLESGKNVILEGPVGVGKTRLALAAVEQLKRPSFRIDGDSRYSEQKLTGWFDPPSVMKHGFSSESFIEGPLTLAMKSGGILFVNELNRLPEGVQNVLLPALDEGILVIPRVGTLRAQPGFVVIATQNPKEFVATSHLSEAILDRFELIRVSYQSELEEESIVFQRIQSLSTSPSTDETDWNHRIARLSVRLVRSTRTHPTIRRGASVRAAISIAELTLGFLTTGLSLEEAFTAAALLALPTRIELDRETGVEEEASARTKNLVEELVNLTLASDSDEAGPSEKKN
jgi:MoxR-like ATPase